MTFDSAFSPASTDAGDSSSSVTSSAPTKARKVRTVKAPSAALFVPITSSAPIRGNYAVTATRDDDTGLDVAVSTVGAVMRVTYHGAHDRTLVAGLKSKQGTGYTIERAQEWGAEAMAASTFRTVTLSAATVSDALAHVMPAMSTDVTRYNLSGLFLDVNGNWVATDGHRLHLFTALESPFNAGVIIPRHAVVALEKAIKATKAESVIIGAGVDMVMFVATGENLTVEIRARLVDGQFPNYTQVIPSTQGQRAFEGDAASVRAAFKAAPVIGDRNVSREFSLESVRHSGPTGIVYGCNAWTRRHDRQLVALPLYGEIRNTLTAHFNARYLDQAFAELDGAVGVYLPDNMSPMRIDNGPRMVIIMPMRA